MSKLSMKRINVTSVARSQGLRLVYLLVGLCGGHLPRNCAMSEQSQKVSDACPAEMTGISGSALGMSMCIQRSHGHRANRSIQTRPVTVELTAAAGDEFPAVT